MLPTDAAEAAASARFTGPVVDRRARPSYRGLRARVLRARHRSRRCVRRSLAFADQMWFLLLVLFGVRAASAAGFSSARCIRLDLPYHVGNNSTSLTAH